MTKQLLFVSMLSSVLLLPSGLSLAADVDRSQDRVQVQQPIYGSQLMTKQERIDHRAKIHEAKSEQEREEIRKEHHKRMVERAKARGQSLPYQAPARSFGPSGSGGMGPGGGRGR